MHHILVGLVLEAIYIMFKMNNAKDRGYVNRTLILDDTTMIIGKISWLPFSSLWIVKPGKWL